MTPHDLIAADRRHIWHPFTQEAIEAERIPIAAAHGATLVTTDGRPILDLISSWWTCIHGHGRPELVQAIAEQAGRLDHVMFAGFTHEPAAALAEALTARLPAGLTRIFFSDDGSTSVEVALKLSYQYWRNKDRTGRQLFLAFEGGYHGDTLGAMALGQGSGFFTLFRDLLCEVHTLPFPATWHGDDAVETREAAALDAAKAALRAHRGRIAAMVLEPLLQGAGGMRMCRPQFLAALVELAREEGVLVVFDEVATGFFRTGSLFACEQAGVSPDIMCLSKGLTAGMLPMAVTAAREDIYAAFLGETFDRALPHGHSFTANPIACAVAYRSLALLDDEVTRGRIRHIGLRHEQILRTLAQHPRVVRPRQLGTVLAFDIAGAEGLYGTVQSRRLRDWYLAHGLNIRPLGATVYLMPPYCISDAELNQGYAGMIDGLDLLDGS